MLDIIPQAQHSGPEQHQERNKLISTLHVGGGGRRKTTTFVYMSEQNKFRPSYMKERKLSDASQTEASGTPEPSEEDEIEKLMKLKLSELK